jgi:ferredoxin-NADP reductase
VGYFLNLNTLQCCVGDRLKIRVGGDFYYHPRDGRLTDLLLIGGGVGVNPLFSMLSHHAGLLSASSTEQSGRVRMLYSSKTGSELLFKVCW